MLWKCGSVYFHLHNKYDVAPDKSTEFPFSTKLKTSNSTHGEIQTTNTGLHLVVPASGSLRLHLVN